MFNAQINPTKYVIREKDGVLCSITKDGKLRKVPLKQKEALEACSSPTTIKEHLEADTFKPWARMVADGRILVEDSSEQPQQQDVPVVLFTDGEYFSTNEDVQEIQVKLLAADFKEAKRFLGLEGVTEVTDPRIKPAFRKARQYYHPDRVTGSDLMFKGVTAAIDKVSSLHDLQVRKLYTDALQACVGLSDAAVFVHKETGETALEMSERVVKETAKAVAALAAELADASEGERQKQTRALQMELGRAEAWEWFWNAVPQQEEAVVEEVELETPTTQVAEEEEVEVEEDIKQVFLLSIWLQYYADACPDEEMDEKECMDVLYETHVEALGTDIAAVFGEDITLEDAFDDSGLQSFTELFWNAVKEEDDVQRIYDYLNGELGQGDKGIADLVHHYVPFETMRDTAFRNLRANGLEVLALASLAELANAVGVEISEGETEKQTIRKLARVTHPDSNINATPEHIEKMTALFQQVQAYKERMNLGL